ncbi:MAG: repair protein RecN [Actinomycetota bacterium]|nr:repair protein RecN [Actinomycetota bacterium]
MLVELHVRDLGVIADLFLVLEPGMTALTGETGAGKTLVVEAIELLLGARADPVLVRPGAQEARVEGRFLVAGKGDGDGDDGGDGGAETVLARVVPRTGRSRAYVDGRLATVAELAERGGALVDLHGQHEHQSLLSPRVQRDALDSFGGVDLRPWAAAKATVSEIDKALAALGGDARSRAREADLLRYQVAELEAAAIVDAGEDERLEAEEDLLAEAAAHRQAAIDANGALRDDGGAADGLAKAIAAVAGRPPYEGLEARLRSVAAEVDDVADEVRQAGDRIVEDPERLDRVRERRRLLLELRRKYGERLSDVIAYQADTCRRLGELESHDARVRELEEERSVAVAAADAAAAAVGRARRAAAPALAKEVARHLQELAMPRARFEVSVGDPDWSGADSSGNRVEFLLGANAGEASLPLAKVASGGELARTMLAARLVLTATSGIRPGTSGIGTGAPPTLVFDEVDAGVGGQAALAVGGALSTLAADHQVLVVTHLPQVAAFADHQVAVTKVERDGRTVADIRTLEQGDRVVELSRMLSGQPSSSTARDHATELLATASASRRRGR